MSKFSKLVPVSGIALMAFGYWGSATAAGMRAFDEMDGLIPLFAGALGAAFTIGGILLWSIARWWTR